MSDSQGPRTISYTVKTWRDGPSRPDETLPAGRIVRVEAEVILPVAATREEILEWAAFEMGGWGSLGDENPLSRHSVDLRNEPTLTDTGYTTDRLIVREASFQEVKRAYDAAKLREQP